jgi:Zn-finger nucleic acid-binding protein
VKCPVCRELMIVVEHADIELDYCVHCKGVWFDATELDLLLRSLGLAEGHDLASLMRLPKRLPAEAPRRCPRCRKKMHKMMIGREPEVMIDSCVRGHGLWFDGGEVEQVIQQLLDEPGVGGRVVSFLGQTLKSHSAKQE